MNKNEQQVINLKINANSIEALARARLKILILGSKAIIQDAEEKQSKAEKVLKDPVFRDTNTLDTINKIDSKFIFCFRFHNFCTDNKLFETVSCFYFKDISLWAHLNSAI